MAGPTPTPRPAATPWRPHTAIGWPADRERLAKAEQRANATVARWYAHATRHDDPTARALELTALHRALSGAEGLPARLADARRDAVLELHAQGLPWVHIARHLGVTITQLQRIRRAPTAKDES